MSKKPNEPSPMIHQYLTIKQEYPDCILFYRMGDFYEMFFEDAVTASKELDLTLTGKDCNMKERAPMCGVPFHAYEQYAQRLIEKGYKVAICEQTNEIVDKLVQRKVIRVITPGTVIDSSMLDTQSNTYIMCIYKSNKTISYVYSDLSTGEICVGEHTGDDILSYINDQIVRVMPAEIIVNSELKQVEKMPPCIEMNNFQLNQYHLCCFF